MTDTARAKLDELIQVVSFNLGEKECGMDILKVHEISWTKARLPVDRG